MELDIEYGKYEVYSDSMNAEVRDASTGKVVKKFKGETAHMDADRFASDLLFAQQTKKGWE